MLKILTSALLCHDLRQFTEGILPKYTYRYAPGHDLLAVLTLVKLPYLFCLFL